jgi:hypothetical protein
MQYSTPMKQLTLVFEGKQLNHSVDVYELADTLIAFSRVIEDIAILNYIGENNKDQSIRINVNAFQGGSFKTLFDLSLQDLLPIATTTAQIVANNPKETLDAIVGTVKNVFALKKFLEGKPAVKYLINGGTNTFNVFNISGGQTTIDLSTFRSIQDRQINENMRKMVEPLSRESAIEDIHIDDDGQKIIDVQKQQYTYFQPLEEVQVTDDHRIKGVVSRLDSKTEAGCLTIKDRRVNFTFDRIPYEAKQSSFALLVESLKLKVPVFLVGLATFDLESQLKKIEVRSVESDIKLF